MQTSIQEAGEAINWPLVYGALILSTTDKAGLVFYGSAESIALGRQLMVRLFEVLRFQAKVSPKISIKNLALELMKAGYWIHKTFNQTRSSHTK